MRPQPSLQRLHTPCELQGSEVGAPSYWHTPEMPHGWQPGWQVTHLPWLATRMVFPDSSGLQAVHTLKLREQSLQFGSAQLLHVPLGVSPPS